MRRRLLWGVLCLLLWSVPLGPTGAIGLDRISDRLVDDLTRAVDDPEVDTRPEKADDIDNGQAYASDRRGDSR